MNKPATFLLAALLLSAAASAQTTFRLGVRGGANYAHAAGAADAQQYSPRELEKSPLWAWQAGLAGEVRWGKLAVQPAVAFSQKGMRTASSYAIVGFTGTDRIETTNTARYNWLEVPLNVVYTRHGDHGWQAFAGPYVALAVGGRQTATTTTYSWTGAVYPDATDRRIPYDAIVNSQRLDAGLNLGLGYRQGPLQAQLSYGLGLRNLRSLVQTIDYVPNYYNRTVQLTGTYFFAL